MKREKYETEVIEMTDPDKLIPTSFIVKLYKITIDENSDKKDKELEKTIEYFPKKYKKKKKYQKSKS